MRPVTLIILAWNSWPVTARCLDSLRTTDLGDTEVLVVDNGSTDETPRRLANYPWLRVLRLPANVGFVRGNNAGIRAVSPDRDVVLLNSDLVFEQPDWLVKLRRCAVDHPDAGVIGCRQIDTKGRLLHAGTYILPDTCWGQQIGGALMRDVGQFARDRDVQGVVFAVAYLRRELLDRVGLLPEAYESYFEDTDYCLQALAAGFRVLVAGGCTVIHDQHGSTRDQAELRSALFRRSQDMFRARWKHRLEDHYTTAVHWQSILNFPTGYAMSSRAILHALTARQTHATYRYVYGPGTVFPIPEPAQTGDYLLNVLAARQPRRDAAGVVYGQGDVFHRNLGPGRKIGYTMLEVDGFPREWVRQANLMDEVWVPTEFNREGMLRSGVTRPIEVVPLGIDLDLFHPGIRGIRNPHGEYVFLSVFEWGERKAPEVLLRAFSQTFAATEPVRLVCKINNVDPTVSLRRAIAGLGLHPAGGRISYLFNQSYRYDELAVLYRSADCYVSPSRGEGWNMPLMEAMACGLPAIATDWGSHRSFFDAEVGYPLQIRGLIPAVAKCPYYAGFSWADPDLEHLSHLLRHVVDHQDEARRLGERAHERVANHFTWDHAARVIEQRLGAA